MVRNLLLLLCLVTCAPALHAQTASWGHNLGLPHNHFISALATMPGGSSITTINTRKVTMNLTGLYMGDLIIQKKDSSGVLEWQKIFNSTAIIQALKIDNAGNIVIAGGYSGVLTLGSYSFTSASSVPSMFLTKLDASGNVLWALAEESSISSNYAARLAIGNSNEIYMTVHKSTEGTFLKYTSAGTLVWTKTVAGIKTFSSIAVDTNGDLFITGTCEPNVLFDAIAPAFPSGTYFTFLAKYNAQAQAQWVQLQQYITFDTRDELLLHNGVLYWLHRRKENASSIVSLTLQKFSRQGALMGEWTPFYLPSLANGKFMSNRFLISSRGEMVISFAVIDTARIVILDSLLTFKQQYLFTSKYIGLGQLAPFINLYNEKLVYGGNFSGATVNIDTLTIPNANTPVTENDIFLTAIKLPGSTPALPVKWIHFNAAIQRNSVVLKWSLASEYNNKGFDIERKDARNSWEKISFVKSAGHSITKTNYSFIDTGVSVGTFYYRLKQVDYDGKYQYSPVVNVKFKGSFVPSLAVLPNPVRDKATLQITVDETTRVEVFIFNSSGVRLKTLLKETFNKGSHSSMIDLSNMASGVYTIQLVANGQSTSCQVVKRI